MNSDNLNKVININLDEITNKKEVINNEKEVINNEKEFKLLNNIDDANEFITKNYTKTLLRKSIIPIIHEVLKNTNINPEKINLFMKDDKFKLVLNKLNINLIITFIHIMLKDLENWVAYKNFKGIDIDNCKEHYKEALKFMQQYSLVSSMIDTLYSIYNFPKVYTFNDIISKFDTILTDDKESNAEFYKIDFEVFGAILVKFLNIVVYYIYSHINMYNERNAKIFKLTNIIGKLNMLFINNDKINNITECYDKLLNL